MRDILKALRAVASIVCVAVVWASGPVAAADYPLTLVVGAEAKNGATTVTSTLTIRVDRLMEERDRTQATDALKFGGYPKFVTALRTFPAVGAIELEKRKVDIRYAREQTDAKGRRLTLVADKPLFFLGEATKARAGYELTIVDLTLDGQGGGTGMMAGAARVKPSPEGGVVLDDFADVRVQLTVRSNRP